jgi:hypothetical protein
MERKPGGVDKIAKLGIEIDNTLYFGHFGAGSTRFL